MDWIGTTSKYYVDAELSNYEARANALARRFPHLRVGIGPAKLNERYLGNDRQQIEDFLQNEAGIVTLHAEKAPAQPTNATENTLVPGTKIVVNMGEIGVVEARFVRALPDGKVMIDLDGIEDVIDASWISVEPVPPKVESAKGPEVAPSKATSSATSAKALEVAPSKATPSETSAKAPEETPVDGNASTQAPEVVPAQQEA